MAPTRPGKQESFPFPHLVERGFVRSLDVIFKEWLKLPGPIESHDALFSYMNKTGNFAPAQEVDRLARGMVTGVARINAQHWRIAALKSTQGNRIFRAMARELSGPVGATITNQIRLNAMLITTLPSSISLSVAEQIDTRQRRGDRPETIARELAARLPGVARYKIDRLARTEVAKANEAITQARSQSMGLNWYQWLTSEDGRVRESHRNMDKVLVNYSDPPSPEALVKEKSVGRYNAGNIWNCRCPAAPIVDLDEIEWPARVYRSGTIRRMTRAQFAKIAGASVER